MSHYIQHQCINKYNYKKPTILILDSGVGGLFIYNIVCKIFPYANYLYFFDNKFFPYGELSESFIVQRVIFIIETMFVQYKCDLVIIACNTITVVSLKILNKQFKFPIIGVIPEIKLATKYTKNGIIGVLGTYQTIKNKIIFNLIKYFSCQYTIVLLEAANLVKLAESKIYGKLILRSDLQDIFSPWLNLKKFPDTLVLGCTHFSLLKKELTKFLSVPSYLVDSEIYCKNYIRFYLNKYFQVQNVKYYQDMYSYNVAYCTMKTAEIMYLKSILLLQYKFSSLEILLL